MIPLARLLCYDYPAVLFITSGAHSFLQIYEILWEQEKRFINPSRIDDFSAESPPWAVNLIPNEPNRIGPGSEEASLAIFYTDDPIHVNREYVITVDWASTQLASVFTRSEVVVSALSGIFCGILQVQVPSLPEVCKCGDET